MWKNVPLPLHFWNFYNAIIYRWTEKKRYPGQILDPSWHIWLQFLDKISFRCKSELYWKKRWQVLHEVKIIYTKYWKNSNESCTFFCWFADWDVRAVQRVPALRGFWDFKKTTLCEIRISGTVGGPLLMWKSPTCAYIGQNRGSRGPR